MKYKSIDVEIRDVQKVQLEILLEFDRICKKNNIPYQLFAGTLLGAVRHKGFIPWDDDIDVCMLRKDYEHFIECCKKDLKSTYFLQDYSTDQKSFLQFAKIRKNNTIFLNSTEAESGMHNGIYIDIFPLDNVSPHTVLGKLHPWVFNAFYIVSSSRVKGRVKNSKNVLNRGLRLMFHYVLKIIPKLAFDRLTQKILKLYETKNTKYANHLTNGVSKNRLKRYVVLKDAFYNIKDYEFEGYMFPGPSNYHEVLTQLFGEYMKLPPEELRYPHHGIYEVNFNTLEETS